MERDVQHIRTSQFITTYGPGSILESSMGPRLIPCIEFGLGTLYCKETFERFEILESRLRLAIRKGAQQNRSQRIRIFTLPTNAVLKVPEKGYIYRTYIFPIWRICYGRNADHKPILFSGNNCPLCKETKKKSSIRFVCACNSGHLDDVNWHFAIHYNSSNKTCKADYYFWMAGGSSLSDINISCPKCKAMINMGNIYAINFRCSGRLPEQEMPIVKGKSPHYSRREKPKKCNKKMKIIQRQSSSLRISETLTLLTIPEYDTPIAKELQKINVAANIQPYIGLILEGKLTIKDFIDKLEESQFIDTRILNIIKNYIKEKSIDDLFSLLNKLYAEDREIIDFIYEEFESLLEGPRTHENFSMSKPINYENNNFSMDIYPINKIRTVTVQIGYTRTPYTRESSDQETSVEDESLTLETNLVSSGTRLEDQYWYPGFEGIGEGLFFTFKNKNPFNFDERTKSEWTVFPKKQSKELNIFNYWEIMVFNPLFIWLHTLCHSVIKSISLYSGYSSATLKERIYINTDGTNGGFLIYTTSAGDDGSMGGLVEASENINIIMEKALENIKYCSNDPLCDEVRRTSNRYNGAACYSCILISETSCEHRNKYLDRHIVEKFLD